MWLEQEYPAIRRQATTDGAQILWGDEMGLRSDHCLGRSFSKKGDMPVILTSGQRFGCNMISAITNQGRLNFMVFKGHFNTAVFLAFLKRLVHHYPHKVFLIVDRHRAHRSAKVQQWVSKNHKHIRLFYLPGCSPELNPDELLNHDIKRNAVGRNRAFNQSELMRNVRCFLFARKRQPHRVKKYFHKETVQYAAA